MSSTSLEGRRELWWAMMHAWQPEMTTWEALELKWPVRVVLCEAEIVSPWCSCLNQLSNVDHLQKDMTSGEEVLSTAGRWSLSSWGTSPSLKVHLLVRWSVHHGQCLNSYGCISSPRQRCSWRGTKTGLRGTLRDQGNKKDAAQQFRRRSWWSQEKKERPGDSGSQVKQACYHYHSHYRSWYNSIVTALRIRWSYHHPHVLRHSV